MRLILTGLLILGWGYGPALAATSPAPAPAPAPASVAATMLSEPTFSDSERRVLRDYYQPAGWNDAKKNPAPGTVKGKALPPGLTGRYEAAGALPASSAWRNLPADLNARLPPRAPGLARVIINRDVLLINRADARVVDVLYDIVTR